jgi:RimJ/RimL family protein N-acetyltransferase
MNHAAAVELRLLEGRADEMAELQGVVEAAPTYAQLVTGSPPGLADAQSMYSNLPEGKSYEDKFVFGVYSDGVMVGCIDLIRGFPDSITALVGLLLIAESVQGRGIGNRSYHLVENYIRAWGTCTKVRIGVVGTNKAVLRFWNKLGFMPTGEVKPYRYGSVVSKVFVLVKSLNDTAA